MRRLSEIIPFGVPGHDVDGRAAFIWYAHPVAAARAGIAVEVELRLIELQKGYVSFLKALGAGIVGIARFGVGVLGHHGDRLLGERLTQR